MKSPICNFLYVKFIYKNLTDLVQEHSFVSNQIVNKHLASRQFVKLWKIHKILMFMGNIYLVRTQSFPEKNILVRMFACVWVSGVINFSFLKVLSTY